GAGRREGEVEAPEGERRTRDERVPQDGGGRQVDPEAVRRGLERRRQVVVRADVSGRRDDEEQPPVSCVEHGVPEGRARQRGVIVVAVDRGEERTDREDGPPRGAEEFREPVTERLRVPRQGN